VVAQREKSLRSQMEGNIKGLEDAVKAAEEDSAEHAKRAKEGRKKIDELNRTIVDRDATIQQRDIQLQDMQRVVDHARSAEQLALTELKDAQARGGQALTHRHTPPCTSPGRPLRMRHSFIPPLTPPFNMAIRTGSHAVHTAVHTAITARF
jgi:chromosome segregation ATPase